MKGHELNPERLESNPKRLESNPECFESDPRCLEQDSTCFEPEPQPKRPDTLEQVLLIRFRLIHDKSEFLTQNIPPVSAIRCR